MNLLLILFGLGVAGQPTSSFQEINEVENSFVSFLQLDLEEGLKLDYRFITKDKTPENRLQIITDDLYEGLTFQIFYSGIFCTYCSIDIPVWYCNLRI